MRNLILTSSRLARLQRCPREYFFSFVINRHPIETPKYFLEGGFLHFILDLYYRAKKANSINIEEITNAAREKSSTIDNLTIEDSEAIIKLFLEYIAYQQDQNWEIEESEVPFAKVLWEDEKFDLRIVIQGKADLLVSAQSVPIIVDHKKISQNRQPFPRDNQIMAYCWAFNRQDFIINQLGTQKTLPPKDKFRRHYFNILGYQIDEWIEETIYNAFEAVKYYDNNHWPARFKACHEQGRACQYYQVCSTEKSNWNYKLETEFRVQEDYDTDIMGE
jgi:hypothetical protein